MGSLCPVDCTMCNVQCTLHIGFLSAVTITQEEEEVPKEEMEGEAMLEQQTRKVKFDEILEDLGDFGKYQKIAYFLLFLPTIFSAMQKQSW